LIPISRDIGDLTIFGWEGKSPSSKIRHSCFLPKQEMFIEMFRPSIGLIPFKKHQIGATINLFIIDLIDGKVTEEEKERMRNYLLNNETC